MFSKLLSSVVGRWATTIFFLTVVGDLGAQAPSHNFVVVDVEVVGVRTATPDLIKSVANLSPGSTLNATVSREVIERINGLGIFADIEILAEEIEGGLKVYIVVKERPKLAHLTFNGTKKIKEEDLRETVKFSAGSYVSPHAIIDRKNDILRAYAEKGYFLTEVDISQNWAADSSTIDLTYTIREKDKIKVRDVFMSGMTRMDSSSLVNAMENRKKGFLRSSNYNKDKYAEDLEKVAQEYHNNGFLDAYVISDSVHIDTAANRIDIFVNTYEGPRYYFGATTFKGATLYTSQQLSRGLKYEKLEVFSQEKYDESIFEVYSAYQEKGHLHTRVEDKRDIADTVINITYDITEGLPSKINLVRIAGNVKTKDHVIRREVPVQPGQVFSRSLLIRSVREAMALNYFTNVMPDVIDLPNGDVDLEFKVEEKQTGQLNAGAGYSARDKLVGTFGMGIPNFRGVGQSLNFSTEFGGRRNSASISFTEPWLFGRPTLLGADLLNQNRRFEGVYTEGRRGGSIRFGKRLRWPDNYFRASLSYRLEANRFSDFSAPYLADNSSQTVANYYHEIVDSLGATVRVTDSAGVLLRSQVFPGSLPSLNETWNIASTVTATLSRDSRNLPQFATDGSQFRYSVSYAGGAMGGYWKYHKHVLDYTHYFPIYKNISLAARTEFGALGAIDGDNRILEFERFSPGGTSYYGVVRGYADGVLTPDSAFTAGDTVRSVTTKIDNSIDTTDISSTAVRTRVRGKFMLVTNVELTIPLATNTLYFLSFFDAGNSWLHWSDIHPITDLYPGAGVGFRLVVPAIGTIGFDFGRSLRRREVGGILQDLEWRTHFQVGTVFQ